MRIDRDNNISPTRDHKCMKSLLILSPLIHARTVVAKSAGACRFHGCRMPSCFTASVLGFSWRPIFASFTACSGESRLGMMPLLVVATMSVRAGHGEGHSPGVELFSIWPQRDGVTMVESSGRRSAPSSRYLLTELGTRFSSRCSNQKIRGL
jgi:hypothetical protein